MNKHLSEKVTLFAICLLGLFKVFTRFAKKPPRLFSQKKGGVDGKLGANLVQTLQTLSNFVQI